MLNLLMVSSAATPVPFSSTRFWAGTDYGWVMEFKAPALQLPRLEKAFTLAQVATELTLHFTIAKRGQGFGVSAEQNRVGLFKDGEPVLLVVQKRGTAEF